MITLRDYQLDAITRVRNAVASGHLRVLLQLPCGAGKTIIAAEIIRGAVTKGRRALLLAHRREILDQTVRKLECAGIDSGAIGVHCADHPRRRDEAPVQIASVQTLVRRDTHQADVVIVDECHHSLATSYHKIVAKHQATGAITIGLTATPCRLSKRESLASEYDVLVRGPVPSALIADGHLVACDLYATRRGPDLRAVRVRQGDYAVEDLESALDQPAMIGDLVQSYRDLGRGLRAICFAVTVKHSKAICAAFLSAGIACEHLDGETPTDARAAILARLHDGTTRVVTGVDVLSEGFDETRAKVLICARPTRSLGWWLQAAGRVCRPSDEDPTCRAIVIDHSGNLLEYGGPDLDREWSLAPADDGPKGGDAPAKQCRQDDCRAVSPTAARVCVDCGAPFHPTCPKCRTVIEIQDVHAPPAEVRCGNRLCKTRSIPYRRIVLNDTASVVPANRAATPPEISALAPGALSPRQIETLRRHGVNPDRTPAAECVRLHAEVVRRASAGLCTLKQARLLARYGYQDTLPYGEAKTLIDRLAANDWHPI